MRPLPVPCHRGILNLTAITRQHRLAWSQLLSIPPIKRSIHHTAPLCRGKSPYMSSIFTEPTGPGRQPQQPNDAHKPSTELDTSERRRVVYNKDGHEPRIQPYMSPPGGKIPSPLTPRYSLRDSREWAKTPPPPKEPLAREEAGFQKDALSVDPLMLLFEQVSPAKGNGGSAAVGAKSKPETGVAAEASSGGEGQLADKEQQLVEKARRLEEMEQRLNALALKLEEGRKELEEGRKGQEEEEGWPAVEETPEPEEEHNPRDAMRKVPPQPARDDAEATLMRLQALQKEDPVAADGHLMGLILLKRQQLERERGNDMGPLRTKESTTHVETQLRRWITENDLHTMMIQRKAREVRRRVDMMKRQRVAIRKKLRIPPESPDPNPQVEAAVQAWLVNRDVQMLVRESRELVRKKARYEYLAQKAERRVARAQSYPTHTREDRRSNMEEKQGKEERMAKQNNKKDRRENRKKYRRQVIEAELQKASRVPLISDPLPRAPPPPDVPPPEVLPRRVSFNTSNNASSNASSNASPNTSDNASFGIRFLPIKKSEFGDI
ncbi:uncharacterized protein B0H64DRAFT_387707 [Chaetomium fimeti]|uniref:Uncharacterized protein n=1 Tax=Chaetomium fimeti TaxID=1854472 RepID=A0AAE0LWG3_9PEZI|nr:hypothetical protein B0H64DRAFT_387707 [Chaetomium fimeti]